MASLSEAEFLEITNSHNSKLFSNMIERMVVDEGVRYIDAIMEYCDTKDIDFEIVPKLLTATLKDKIQAEAMDFNFFPKIGQLPL